MGFWKDLSICLLIVIIIGIISHEVSRRTCSHYMRDCISINGLSNAILNAPVKRLYLAAAKLFPIINSISTTHWSVVVETDLGYVNISTSRFMTIHLYQVMHNGPYYFIPLKWERRLFTLKSYSLKNSIDGPVTPYTIALSALDFYNKNDKLSYSLINHNCQHVSQFIIKEFGDFEEDDAFLTKCSGYALIKRSIKDAFNGPKAMI